MHYGTIIFIAFILVVACGLIYWLSALCGGLLAPEARRKGAQEASSFQLEMKTNETLTGSWDRWAQSTDMFFTTTIAVSSPEPSQLPP